MKTQNIVTLVLVVLLLLSFGYIIFDKYRTGLARQQISIYQQGFQQGYNQTLTFLFQQASTCRQVPLTFQNITINLVAIECLQKTG
jgi:hypothetical protein